MKCAVEVRFKSMRLWTAALVAAVTVCVGLAPTAAAATISQSYIPDSTLTPGMLASTLAAQSGTVTAADSDNEDALVGIIVTQKDATLAVGSSNGVQVATSGTANAYVSDINGAVKSGDYIAASPIKGVGMKATTDSKVVGVAQADAPTSGTQVVSVIGKDGKKTTAHVSTVPVALQPGAYAPPSKNRSAAPQQLQVFANSVAGKPVAVLRVLISATIVLIALIVSTIMVAAAIRSTMVSLGRNPLARGSIYRGLWQVIITAVVIMAVALISSYVVLTR